MSLAERRKQRQNRLPLRYRVMTYLQRFARLPGFMYTGISKYGAYASQKQDHLFFSEQQKLFVDYIKKLAKSDFGKDHGITDFVQDLNTAELLYKKFSESCGVYGYSDIAEYVHKKNGMRPEEGKTRYYALSGGTTDINQSNKKFIYVPEEVRALTEKAFLRLLLSYIARYPNTKILTKKVLPLGGSIRKRESDRKAGDVSVYLIEQASRRTRLLYPYPVDILIAGREEKYPLFLETFGRFPTGAIMGVTKRTALLLQDLTKRYPEKLAEFKEHLEVIFWGGVDIGPYQEVFDARGIERRIGMYNAAEGVIGYQDIEMMEQGIRYRFASTGLLEFAPRSSFDTEGKFIAGSEIVASRELTEEVLASWGNTAILVYSAAGQVRSVMDMLHLEIFPSLKAGGPQRIRFQIMGRATGFINLTGEELLDQQARLALQSAAQELGLEVGQYTIAPAKASETGGQFHEWLIEYTMNESSSALREQFEDRLDAWLQRINGDYADKRQVGRLGKQQIKRIRSGGFDAYLLAQGKTGGQNKILTMSQKREYIEHVKSFFEKEGYMEFC